MEELIRSVLNMDRAPVVLCDLEHTVKYMNAAAVRRYGDILGSNVLDCHNEKSCEIINRVVEWFSASADNNMIYTFRNEKENKDVYMVALRDSEKKLIGYYEKHEYRTNETASIYDFTKSLV